MNEYSLAKVQLFNYLAVKDLLTYIGKKIGYF